MYKLDEVDIEYYKQTEEGQAYLRYYEVTKGRPLVLTVPYGYPEGVDERGGAIAVYEECIEKGITWEELLNYKEPVYDDDILI